MLNFNAKFFSFLLTLCVHAAFLFLSRACSRPRFQYTGAGVGGAGKAAMASALSVGTCGAMCASVSAMGLPNHECTMKKGGSSCAPAAKMRGQSAAS